jgi:hypothetical protein
VIKSGSSFTKQGQKLSIPKESSEYQEKLVNEAQTLEMTAFEESLGDLNNDTENAIGGTRTHNRRLRRPLLFQLSYNRLKAF